MSSSRSIAGFAESSAASFGGVGSIPAIRQTQLKLRGINPADAKLTAHNGRGPWFTSGTRVIGEAIPSAELRKLGLVSLAQAQQRLAYAV
jgi:hypothetical protein